MPTESNEFPLPADWSEVEDPTSGQVYYYNATTGETAWDRPLSTEPPMILDVPSNPRLEKDHAETDLFVADEPEVAIEEVEVISTQTLIEVEQEEARMPTECVVDSNEFPLPAVWSEVEDPTSGQVYYYNATTGETSWERPIPAQPPSTLDLLHDMRYKVEDHQSQMQLHAIEVPESATEEVEARHDEVEQTTRSIVDCEECPLPVDWSEVEDSASGQVYYYNSTTGETSWDRPIPAERPSTLDGLHLVQDDVEGEQVESPADDNSGLAVNEDETTSGYCNDETKVTPERLKNEQGKAPPPTDWSEVEDPTSGRIYYFNVKTGETSWVCPTPTERQYTSDIAEQQTVGEEVVEQEQEEIESESNASQQSVPIGAHQVMADFSTEADQTRLLPADAYAVRDNSPLPTEWVEREDPTSGLVYYYNSTTGDTAWERPSRSEQHSVQELPPEEHKVPDEKNYVETETEAFVAEEPESEIEDAMVTSAQPSNEVEQAAAPTTGSDEVPFGWSEMEDPTSGQIYYYNSTTGETSLDRPTHAERLSSMLEPDPVIGNEMKNLPRDVPESEVEEEVPTDHIQEEPPLPRHTHTRSEESSLPAEWSEVMEPTIGQVYYYNSTTGETAWDRPIPADASSTLNFLGEVHQDIGEDHGETDPLADEPEVAVEELEETTYQVPIEVPIEVEHELASPTKALGNSDEPPLPIDWAEVEDASSGKLFYYNSATGESSWDRPLPVEPPSPSDVLHKRQQYFKSDHDLKELSAAKEPESAVKEKEAEDVKDMQTLPTGPLVASYEFPLPACWSEVENPTSGQVYYYNSTTGETSWDRPVPAESGSTSPLIQQQTLHLDDDPAITNTLELPTSDEEEKQQMVDDVFASLNSEFGIEDMRNEASDVGKAVEPEGQEVERAVPEARIADSEYEWPSSSEDEESEASAVSTDEPTRMGDEAGWIELRDGNDNIYYYNIITHETSWDRAVAASIVASSKDESDMDDHRNDAVAEAELDAHNSEPPVGWVTKEKPGTGRTHLFNHEAGLTSSDFPFKDLADSEPELSSCQLNPEVILPGDWNMVEDPSDGAVYYYNSTTGETSWERPTEGDTIVSKSTPMYEEKEGMNTTTVDSHDVQKHLQTNHAAQVPGAISSAEGHDALGDSTSVQPATLAETDNADDCSTLMHEVLGAAGHSQASPCPDQYQAFRDETPPLFALPEFWTSAIDEASGRTYFFNSLTQETSWNRPEYDNCGPEVYVAKNMETEYGTAPTNNPYYEDGLDKPDSPPCANAIRAERDITGELLSGDTFQEPEPEHVFDGSHDKRKVYDGYTIPDEPTPGNINQINAITGKTSLEIHSSKPDGADPPKLESEDPITSNDWQTCKDIIGWSEFTDPQSGETYYVNDSTGETSWAIPLVKDNTIEALPTHEFREAYDAKPESVILPEGWAAIKDTQSGETYFVNVESGETSWEPPFKSQPQKGEVDTAKQPVRSNETKRDAYLPEASSEPLAELPVGWDAVVDPASGEIYFFNEETGETSWDRPRDERKAVPVLHVCSPDEQARPDGWRVVGDDTSGEKSFVDDVDKTMSWDRPNRLNNDDGVLVENEPPDNASNELKEGWVTINGDRCHSEGNVKPAPSQVVEAAPSTSESWQEISPELERTTGVLKQIMASEEWVHLSHATQDCFATLFQKSRSMGGISSPLISTDDSLVRKYIQQKSKDDILWQLIEVAANSKGRLRSDEGVQNSRSPESAIVKILLDDNPTSSHASPTSGDHIVHFDGGETMFSFFRGVLFGRV